MRVVFCSKVFYDWLIYYAGLIIIVFSANYLPFYLVCIQKSSYFTDFAFIPSKSKELVIGTST